MMRVRVETMSCGNSHLSDRDLIICKTGDVGYGP